MKDITFMMVVLDDLINSIDEMEELLYVLNRI